MTITLTSVRVLAAQVICCACLLAVVPSCGIGTTAAAAAHDDDTYGGVTYYIENQFHLPQYRLSRNLVQNPSFRQGFRYWQWATIGRVKSLKNPDNYVLEPRGGRTGDPCVKILGEQGQSPANLTSFAIPVDTGKSYTLSFYARSDNPGAHVSAMVTTARWGVFPLQRSFSVSGQWQRYAATFTAPNAALNVGFGIDSPPIDETAEVDDVQLESGPETEFSGKEAELSLITDHRDNLFLPEEPVHARWAIFGTPNLRGTLTVTQRDFLGRTLKTATVPVVIGAAGSAVYAEPWAEKTDNGLYIQEADLQLKDGFSLREFGRLAIMPAVSPNSKHHTLFASGGTGDRLASWDRIVTHFARYGIGSDVNFGTPPAAYLAVLNAHHITNVGAIFDGGETTGPWNLNRGWNGTDADLPAIEQRAYEKAKANPAIIYWKLVNEPGGSALFDLANMKNWLKPQAAARRGILRANPQALIFSPDPSNMSPKGGTRFIDTFLTAGGQSVCDLIAIHPYRTRPETPDFDSELATFLAMLDRHGYHGDVWFTEGGGHAPLHLPSFGIDVHESLSSERTGTWRIGPLSYDIGWGEKLSAAYAMRAWLVGLKYGNRIKQQVEWYYATGNSLLDYDCTPMAESFASNTPASLLGDSRFLQDVPLGRNVRCYLFADAQNCPVAAIWTYDLAHEATLTPGPVLHLGSAAPQQLAITNMVGSREAMASNGDIHLTPFPIFLRGKPNTAAKVAAMLESSVDMSTSDATAGYAQVKDGGHVAFGLRNTLPQTITGRLKVVTAGKSVATDIVRILPGKTLELNAPFVTPVGGMLQQEAILQWLPTGGAATRGQSFPIHVESLSCPRVVGPLPLAGDITRWKSAGANAVVLSRRTADFVLGSAAAAHPKGVPWKGPKDLSATMYIAYDERDLFLAFAVKDDVFAPASSLDTSWTGDGVQLYFDAWADGHSQATKGFGVDDQAFDVWPGAAGVQVKRSTAPDVQTAFLKVGLVTEINSAFTKTADGYVIRLQIPERELAPLILKPGTVFNFACLINDNDGDYRKRGLTLTPAGTEPYTHPELYPSVVLAP